MPKPKDKWVLAFSRSRSNRSGSGKCASSRLPEHSASSSLAPFRNRHARDFDRLDRLAPPGDDRGVEAQQLLDRIRNQRRVGAQPLPGVAMLHQRDDRIRGHAGGRLVPRDQQAVDHVGDLVDRQVALVLPADADQIADIVVRGIGHQPLDVGFGVLPVLEQPVRFAPSAARRRACPRSASGGCATRSSPARRPPPACRGR